MTHRGLIWAILMPFVVATVALGAPPPAASVGTIKVARGAAWIERAGIRYAAHIAMGVRESDVLATGNDGSLGVVFADDSLISIGPNSALGIVRLIYDPVTRVGKFDTHLLVGTMTVSSGRLARTSPNAMTVTTPQSTIRVRDADFSVRAKGAK